MCSLSMFRVSWCVFCSISLLFDYVCMRLPFIPWSIVGVPSGHALPGNLITARPPVCVPDVIGALAVWIQNQKKKSSWNYFAMFSTTRGQTATWQCCCSIGRFSARLRVQTHRKVRHGQTGVWVSSSYGFLFGGSDRIYVPQKIQWAYFFWGQ